MAELADLTERVDALELAVIRVLGRLADDLDARARRGRSPALAEAAAALREDLRALFRPREDT
ncbi:MAG: hypothetical protein ACYDAQ_01695 [Mycobacteriales bacterium]